MTVDRTILGHLALNDGYMRKVLPFLKDEYFLEKPERTVFSIIAEHINTYGACPTKEALTIELGKKSGLPEDVFKAASGIILGLSADENTDPKWLLDQTEKFCQEKALYNGIIKSVTIFDNKDGKLDRGAIPKILTDALAVSFDPNIGHDLLENWDERYETYHKVEARIPFDLEMFNRITRGGLPRKTLNVVLGGVGVGKSLTLCHMATANLSQGLNVLYITLEMAEEKIAERIDANILDTPISELALIEKAKYQRMITEVRKRTKGRLIIKEYPTASAGANHFRFLLNELRLKKNFVPDIIYLDYLNLCISSRMKYSGNVNSYTYVKAISEEIRGLAIEFNVPIVTASQLNREGFSSTDVEMTHTSESFGLPMTVDLLVALISTEELQNSNQYIVKQLKNRYNDPTYFRKFSIRVDRSRMRLYDADEQPTEDVPVMDRTEFGQRSSDKSRFGGFV